MKCNKCNSEMEEIDVKVEGLKTAHVSYGYQCKSCKLTAPVCLTFNKEIS